MSSTEILRGNFRRVAQMNSRIQAVDVLRGITPLATVFAMFGMCAGRLFLLVRKYSVNILFGDQWVFDDATIFQNHSLIEIFRWQHGPHRQGLGGLLAKLIEPFISWNSRYEAFGIWAIICLACLAALFLKRRLFGKIDYVDVIIPLLFLTPVQYEVLFGGVSPSHGPLPVLLVIVYCLAWTLENERWRYGSIIGLNFLLIYTGFGLFMGVITPCLLTLQFLRRHDWKILGYCALSLLSLASFLVGYHLNTAAGCAVNLVNPTYYFLFVAFMLARFIQIYASQALIPAMIVGSLLAFSLVWITASFVVKTIKRPSSRTVVISTLLAYSLVFSFATAYGRLCLGLGAAQGSRYMSYLVLCFFGSYLAGLSINSKFERRIFVSFVCALTLLSSAQVDSTTKATLEQSREQREQWKTCYFRSHNIEVCDAETHGYICWRPEPENLKYKVDFLEQHHLNFFSAKP